MNLANHPCPSFGKGGDTAQASYAEVFSVIKIFKVFKVIKDHNANQLLTPLLLTPFTPHLIICPLTSYNLP